MTIEDDAEYEDRLAKRTRERDLLARQLYEVKHKHADYIETVRDAIADSIGRLTLAPVDPPTWQELGGQRRQPEHAIALLSDMQTGKLTPDYNSDVCRERVMRYAARIVEIAEVQRAHHPVDEITVCMLGDMIEGVDIFPGQQWLIDSTLYDQLFNTTPAILADFCRYLLAHFEKVHVLAVDGNHGRIGRKGQYGPMDNADRMVYRILGLLMRDEPRFDLTMTDPQGERNWYMVGQWGNYSAMLIHGDQIRGSNGFPWYGLGKKVNGWASGGIEERFDDLFMGHYHQLGRMPLNQRSVWANGSTESTNTFAAETLAAQSEPSQWLLFCDPDAGHITASYGVGLR
ncbi:hypothetical protein ACGFZA_15890 [Streptomyces sp. NPDC048211]|uniref:hypothetical protein n=1 Tax=Streptomyces sp. NPDC048211 TaxID=3365516 RepID=UPI0037124145